MKTKEQKKKQSKKRISQQIQKQIGSIVLAILLVIEVVSILMVRATVMNAKETELTLESKAASYQLGDYFDQYKRMTEQLAVNPQSMDLLIPKAMIPYLRICSTLQRQIVIIY